MKFYLAVVILGNALLITLNHFFGSQLFNLEWFPLLFIILGVVGSTIGAIAIDATTAGLCHLIQNRLNLFSKYFYASKRQRNIMRRFGVGKFKNFLPDLGVLVKFPKGKIVDPKSKEYVHRYIMESCSGELGHIVGLFAVIAIGLLTLFFIPQFFLPFILPIITINTILCFLPVLSLRYNRCALYTIYQILDKRENRTAEQPHSINGLGGIKGLEVLEEDFCENPI